MRTERDDVTHLKWVAFDAMQDVDLLEKKLDWVCFKQLPVVIGHCSDFKTFALRRNEEAHHHR